MDLRSEVVNESLGSPLELPELLLWITIGQRFFDAFSETPNNFSYSKDIDILTNYADDVATRPLSKYVFVELECG